VRCSFCGYFYWDGSNGQCRSRYLSTSWTMSCNTGFYLRAGTSIYGVCNGEKSCCYDSAGGYASSCYNVSVPREGARAPLAPREGARALLASPRTGARADVAL